MTVKEPKEQDSVGFNQLLKEEDVSGLSEDERMARIAKKMEMKFKQEGSQRDEEVCNTFKSKSSGWFNLQTRLYAKISSKWPSKASKYVLLKCYLYLAPSLFLLPDFPFI